LKPSSNGRYPFTDTEHIFKAFNKLLDPDVTLDQSTGQKAKKMESFVTRLCTKYEDALKDAVKGDEYIKQREFLAEQLKKSRARSQSRRRAETDPAALRESPEPENGGAASPPQPRQEIREDLRALEQQLAKEREDKKLCEWKFSDNTSLEVSKEPGSSQEARKFKYDRVFDCHATQEDVFNEVMLMTESVMKGGNVCILAYG
jgi:hypothetical protein